MTPSREAIEAFRIVEEALDQHIRMAHPDEEWPHDLVCERCRELHARSEEFISEGMRLLPKHLQPADRGGPS